MASLVGIVFLCIATAVRCTDFSGYPSVVHKAKPVQIRKLLLEHQLQLSEHREETVRNQVDTNNSLNTLRDAILDLQSYMPFRSCKEVPKKVSGVYSIRSDYQSSPFPVYCEQINFGGGWLVIKNRINGSLDFNRSWTEYRDGFGDIEQEFWIGLERLYRLTSRHPYELIIELAKRDDEQKYAHYAGFKIGNETEKYILKTIGPYNGTAKDFLTHLQYIEFSTYDRDNDNSAKSNCAGSNKLGWWFDRCGLPESDSSCDFRKGCDIIRYYRETIYLRIMIRPI
ncbi:fibrinogen-like protein 1 [Anopheles bellator]|uniref:fibrinogen-like protein 1 n=1 Tax=Anopheles bellator TaxID=139047 RepID=UPI00264A45F2|nr:fibrinogen-like protein 1 [Anopheles bellator]